jgi:hypothetical protein
VKELRECKLFPPVRDWLAVQGYDVFAELWGHDVVARRDDRLVVVELKMACTRTLIRQCARAATFTDATYAAVPARPREESLGFCRRYQIGVLVVSDSGVTMLLESGCSKFPPEHDRMLERMKGWKPAADQVGGVPTLAGGGDAQRVGRMVDDYRMANPGCSWRDIYRDVPNHYAHHRSMQQALRGVIEKEARHA